MKQIALVLTFYDTQITKEEVIKKLQDLKPSLTDTFKNTFGEVFVNDSTLVNNFETIYIDGKYDDWY